MKYRIVTTFSEQDVTGYTCKDVLFSERMIEDGEKIDDWSFVVNSCDKAYKILDELNFNQRDVEWKISVFESEECPIEVYVKWASEIAQDFLKGEQT